jgi:hypothetical protein
VNRRRALVFAAGLYAAAGGGSFGCAKEEERPPPETCLGANCGHPPGNVGSIPGSGGSSGGTDNDGGEAGDPAGVTLTGTVALLLDDEFVRADPFPEPVDLRAESADGSNATGLWTGNVSDPFSIENVQHARATWVYGVPRGSGSDALPTLEPMRTDEPDADGVVESEEPFVLARESVLEQIYGVLSTPIDIDPTKAQIVLKLYTDDDPPRGAEGIRVTAPQAGVVIYAINGAFSEIPTETDSTGLVVLANAAGSSWPGALIDVSFSGEQMSAVEVRAITGAVTIASVVP